MRINILTSVLAVIFIILSAAAPSCAQVSDSLKAELRKASDLLFHNGNTNYLQVDAICDGYLALNTHYTLVYGYGHISINEKELPHAYMEKLRSFYAENYRKFDNSFRMTSDGISLKDILDTPSGLVMLPPGPLMMIGVGCGYAGAAGKIDSKKIITHLIAMMVADGVIDTSYYFNLSFDFNKQLIVNDQKIEDKYASKYAVALKDDGFDIVGEIGNIHYNNNYRKHW